MSLADSDRELVVEELGRDPTRAEEALFENLWSEHCAYRSSRPLLSAFDSEGERVVVGPGDDAAVVSLDDETYVTMGIESHNHPSYVDPYDGAATGVGGIVRDTLSMGAYPIALADSLYFGGLVEPRSTARRTASDDVDREHSRYLFEGVVEGIGDYGNSIGVPTVAGSVAFHDDYEGNPLVNVACVGLIDDPDRLVTAEAQEPGNKLVLVGNATGRDGLGGASFASEDLSEDAETEDRPAVQVGDPYTEKLLIEASEDLVEADLIESARDLGAAGLGGASSELVAKGGLGAAVELDRVHRREPNMNALEILLAESQERMCYAPAEFLGEGAPTNDLPHEEPERPDRDLPDADLAEAFEAVVGSPNTASKRWVYRQYDHEVGVRTSVPPGDDAAVLAVREAEQGLAISSGADPNWTDAAPYEGARAVALENATNLAAKGATPLAAVDCLNGGNPEKPDVYGGFKGIVDGLADMCSALDAPVVGGNVSLYNDSPSGPIPPTPTLAMTGTKERYGAPPLAADEDAAVLVVGDPALDGRDLGLGGSEYLAQFGGSDRFPELADDPAAFVETLADVADADATRAVHDVSHGGLAVALAEMVTDDAGLDVSLPAAADPTAALFHERPGRAVVQTTDPVAVRAAFDGVAPVRAVGEGTPTGGLSVDAGGTELAYDADAVAGLRSVIDDRMS
ncbi:phosphoribosylformylglycinamidine synthase II [Halobacteriales archaeon QS_9_68_17]|nr:MAG: phosphoribosylformylglycinamidine synthase II [Halobacteriales archaeon QS_9_68_17]